MLPRILALVVVITTSAVASAQSTQPTGFTFDIHGVVTDRAGAPIANGQIDVFAGGRNYEPPRPWVKIGQARADDRGRFVVKAVNKPSENAPYWIRATSPGMAYAYRTGPFFTTDGERVQVGPRGPDGVELAHLVMRPAQTIRGRVVDESGAPVAGAEIICDLPIEAIRTNENGEFVFDRAMPAADGARHELPNRTFYVRHPDFVVDRIGTARFSNNVEMKVRRGVLVSGRLVEEDKTTPVRGGSVMARFEPRPYGPPYNQFAAQCDDDGRYQLRLPADLGLVDIHAYGPTDENSTRRYEAVEQFHRIVTDTAERFDVDFVFRRKPDVPRLKPNRPRTPMTRPLLYQDLNLPGIAGKMVDENGKPVPHARMYIVDLASPYERDPRRPIARKPIATETGADFAGEFRCKDIDSDQPLLILAWDGTGERIAQLVTEPGQREVELRLTERSGRIAGTIRDESGKPIEGIPLQLYIKREAEPNLIMAILHAVTDENGRYEFVGYHPPAEGIDDWIQVESPGSNWYMSPEMEITDRGLKYVHFPVKPGETLDGLDYTIQQAGQRVAVPTREEFTREP